MIMSIDKENLEKIIGDLEAEISRLKTRIEQLTNNPEPGTSPTELFDLQERLATRELFLQDLRSESKELDRVQGEIENLHARRQEAEQPGTNPAEAIRLQTLIDASEAQLEHLQQKIQDERKGVATIEYDDGSSVESKPLPGSDLFDSTYDWPGRDTDTPPLRGTYSDSSGYLSPMPQDPLELEDIEATISRAVHEGKEISILYTDKTGAMRAETISPSRLQVLPVHDDEPGLPPMLDEDKSYNLHIQPQSSSGLASFVGHLWKGGAKEEKVPIESIKSFEIQQSSPAKTPGSGRD